MRTCLKESAQPTSRSLGPCQQSEHGNPAPAPKPAITPAPMGAASWQSAVCDVTSITRTCCPSAQATRLPSHRMQLTAEPVPGNSIVCRSCLPLPIIEYQAEAEAGRCRSSWPDSVPTRKTPAAGPACSAGAVSSSLSIASALGCRHTALRASPKEAVDWRSSSPAMISSTATPLSAPLSMTRSPSYSTDSAVMGRASTCADFTSSPDRFTTWR
mmetsp:Transcript_16883/g.37496  ORF Transcript_16883/g.37496 Transcript_16883/m.37496 type:complete len:214 (+) Transcript_16883:942-1583(+)